jgi:hypothetical protein
MPVHNKYVCWVVNMWVGIDACIQTRMRTGTHALRIYSFVSLFVCSSMSIYSSINYLVLLLMRKKLRFQTFVHSKPVCIANPKVSKIACGYLVLVNSNVHAVLHRKSVFICHMYNCTCMCMNNVYLSINRSIYLIKSDLIICNITL